MREPSTDEKLLAWYRQALRDAEFHIDLTIDWNEPQCGWFQTRLARGGPFVPARIYMEQEVCADTRELISDEAMKCEINGRPCDLLDGWQRIAGDPIERSLFNYLTATVKWTGENAPDEPLANPRQATNWLRTPTPTF